MTSKVYDWAIVGGGIAGICVAEMLTREGYSVVLLEKNEELASETSKVFHEWLHTGSLFTLVPDRLLTTRYLLGAIDDLLEYYHSFPRMNLRATENGLKVKGQGWFNNKNILFKYRNRKLNPIWMSIVSRSVNNVKKIRTHDWLRRRAGSMYGDSRLSRKNWIDRIPKQMLSEDKFIEVKSPDITINSRVLIPDILSYAESKGLVVKTGEEAIGIKNIAGQITVKTVNTEYKSKNVLVCTPDLVETIFSKKTKISYAPIGVVENIPKEADSFVELDYYTKNCINLIIKNDGIGQAGGISVSKQDDVKPYMDYVIKQHKKRTPEINLIDQYVGLKKELVSKGQERNYLYHIEKHDDHVWSLILGKFTLAFSAAPEFYRRVYKKNPRKFFNVSEIRSSSKFKVSETSWQEIVNKK